MTKKTSRANPAVASANERAVKLWAAGRSAEARQLLLDFLAQAGPLAPDDELQTKNNLAMFERALGLYAEARQTHMGAAHLADATKDHALHGKFHNGLGLCLKNLGDPDGARLEFTAASYYYEKAGERRMRADVENNLAILELDDGHLELAVGHLKLAYDCYPNSSTRAIWLETEARIEIAAGRGRSALAASIPSVPLDMLLGGEDDRVLTQNVETLVRAGQLFLRQQEAQRILRALHQADWNVTRAAAALGLNNRQTLQHRIKKHFKGATARELRRKGSFASRG